MRVGRGGRTESSAPTGWDVEDAVPYSAKRCHCEPVTVSLVWQSVIPRLPLRGRCQREAVTEGETAHIPRRDTWVPPYRARRVC